MTGFFARIGQAFRSLPTTGTNVAVVLSGVLALAIAGPLVYRAIDDDGGGGGDTTTAAGPDSGANQGNGNANGQGGGANDTEPGGAPSPGDSGGGGAGGTGTGGGTSGTGTAGGGTAGGETQPPTEPPPVTVPPTTTPTTTNPPVQPAPELLVSKEPNRAGAMPLDGAVLIGPVHPFVVDANSATDRVDFFWDDPDMKGAPFSTDPDPEFDFCGTDPKGLAFPFNTVSVPNGSHVVTVKVTGLAGPPIVLSAKVDIRNVIPPVLPPICELPVLE